MLVFVYETNNVPSLVWSVATQSDWHNSRAETLWQSKTEPVGAEEGLTLHEFGLPGEELPHGTTTFFWKQHLPWVSLRNNLWQIFSFLLLFNI